jgi:hypothetical protein
MVYNQSALMITTQPIHSYSGLLYVKYSIYTHKAKSSEKRYNSQTTIKSSQNLDIIAYGIFLHSKKKKKKKKKKKTL